MLWFWLSTTPVESRKAAASGGVDEPCHQRPRDAAALPIVGDDNRELRALAIGIRDVARDADEFLVPRPCR